MRLAVRILHLLGETGPKMPNPTRYIRYIYNRTILENSPVRAAAVAALAKFAVTLGGEIRENVSVLLTRSVIYYTFVDTHSSVDAWMILMMKSATELSCT